MIGRRGLRGSRGRRASQRFPRDPPDFDDPDPPPEGLLFAGALAGFGAGFAALAPPAGDGELFAPASPPGAAGAGLEAPGAASFFAASCQELDR